MWRRFAIITTLANLCMLWVWVVFFTETTNAYYMETVPDLKDLAALLLNVLLLSLVMWLAARVAGATLPRPATLRLMGLVYLLIGAWALFQVYRSVEDPIPYLRLGVWLKSVGRLPVAGAGVTLLMALMALMVYRPSLITRVGAGAALMVCPFFLLSIGRGVWLAGGSAVVPTRAAAHVSATRVPDRGPKHQSSRRIVWLVFDALDERVLSTDRPTSLHLPEFDRFRAECIYATDASSPARSTLVSMPSLICGKQVETARPLGANDLLLTYAGEKQPVRWSQQPTVFSVARELGYEAGVIGYYHPYPRVLGHVLAESSGAPWCFWGSREDYSLLAAMKVQMQAEVCQMRNCSSTDRWQASYSLAICRRTHAEALRAAADPGLDLVLMHYPVPHPSYIYDRLTGQFTIGGDGRRSDYYDNVALSDRLFGDVRREMEDSGLWANTTVLVTADHGWRVKRGEEERSLQVPFMLGLAGQRGPLVYDSHFSTVVTKDLFVELLRGRLDDPRLVASWLDGRTAPALRDASRKRLHPDHRELCGPDDPVGE